MAAPQTKGTSHQAASFTLCSTIPKAELHVHIEGTMEVALMYALAKRNHITLKNPSPQKEQALRTHFKNLDEFLTLYYQACSVLRTQTDFRDLAFEYLQRASQYNNVLYVEMFFDPQTHTRRGIPLHTVVAGLVQGCTDARERYHIRAQLIMCMLRHLSPAEECMPTMLAYEKLCDSLKQHIIAIGLDSSELPYPPKLFTKIYARARKDGLHAVAHAGEEGPPSYIIQALDILKVRRIDHGVRCLEDKKCIERLVKDQIPLTVCPLSNLKLQVDERCFGGNCCVPLLLKRGLKITINSDDPAYFGGYIAENMEYCKFSEEQLYQVCENSFTSTFLPANEQAVYVKALKTFWLKYQRSKSKSKNKPQKHKHKRTRIVSNNNVKKKINKKRKTIKQ